MRPTRVDRRSLRLALCAAGALLSVAAAIAASGAENAQKAYERDRAACNDGRTNQDRATCLREAGAALREAKRGIRVEDQVQLDRNRLARCESQPPQDRQDCVRRMNGEGTTSGSVESGGIYRELITPVVTPAVTPAVPPQRN